MSAGNLLMRAGNKAAWSPDVLSRSVLKDWFSADDHGTANMTDDGAGLISAWAGRISGTATTAATTARPTWAVAAFNSSYAGLSFNAVANCMVTTTFPAIPQGSADGEIWAVYGATVSTAATGYITLYGGTSGATRRGLFLGSSIPTKPSITDGAANLADANSGIGNHIVSGYWGGTTEGGIVDGRDFSPTASATIATLATTGTRLRIGANTGTSAAGFSNMVLRHLMFTTTLSAADRQRLQGWLAWDSGLTSLLPDSHPYKNMRP